MNYALYSHGVHESLGPTQFPRLGSISISAESAFLDETEAGVLHGH